MKSKFHVLLAGAIPASCASLTCRANSSHAEERLGREKPINEYTRIEIKNIQGESLGRITDLGLDLTNGRIVVYVASSFNTTTGPLASSELWGHTGTTPGGGDYVRFGSRGQK